MKTLLALATLKIVARAFFYLRQRQDNDKTTQDNDKTTQILVKIQCLCDFHRLQDNKTTKSHFKLYIYIYYYYIYPIFSLFYSLCCILFYFLEDIEKCCLCCLIMPLNTDKYWIFYKTTPPKKCCLLLSCVVLLLSYPEEKI